MNVLDSSLFKLILSSAVVVALITSLFNYFISRKTNARLLEIEDLKRRTGLDAYRYTNIFEGIKEINSFPAVNYNYLKRNETGSMVQDKELFRRVVEQTTERYSKIISVYDRISPLIDAELLSEISTAIHRSEAQSNLLTESLYANTPLPEGVDVVTLMQARQNAEREILESMKRQVAKLTASSSRNS
jgi:hypothetical protein